MSKEIDQRIVEMTFDNSQFDSRISKSLLVLDKLKNSIISLGTTSESLKGFQNSLDRVDFNSISSALESVSDRFSALGIIGMNVLSNLTNKAVDFGLNFARSLSLDQVMAGFNKYTQETKGVQTITAATGKSVKEVEGYLADLMDYADKTSYDYVTMVQSVGKFTSAGVDLGKAVTAMKGINNEAAISGASIEEANRAMYNFAQSIGMGKLLAQDWKSIENANMATREFKEEIIKTGLEMGTLRKNSKGVAVTTKGTEVTFSNFRETLRDAWVTSEVLMGTLERYGDAQTELGKKGLAAASEAKTFAEAVGAVKDAVSTGWSNTFKLLFGNYDEAKKTWTGFQDALLEIFTLGQDRRNKILEQWHKTEGGYDSMLRSFHNAWIGIKNIAAPIAEAWNSMFPGITSSMLSDITKKVETLSIKLRYLFQLDQTDEFGNTFLGGGEAAKKRVENLKRAFNGLFSVFEIGKMALKAVGEEFVKIVKFFAPGIDSSLEFAGSLGDVFTNLKNVLSANDSFRKIFESINKLFLPIATKIRDIIHQIVEQLKIWFGYMDESFFNEIGSKFGKIGEKVGLLGDKIKEFFQTHFGKPDTSGMEELAEESEKALSPIQKLFEYLKGAWEYLKNLGTKAYDGIVKVASAIREKLAPLFTYIKDGFNKLTNNGDPMTILTRIFEGGLILKLLQSLQNFSKLGKAAGGLAGMFDKIKDIPDKISGVFDGLGKAIGKFKKDINLKTLKTVAASILILAVSLALIAGIPTDQLSNATIAIGALLGELVGSIALLGAFGGNNRNAKSLQKTAKAMVAMAAAVLILSFAMKNLSSLKPEELKTGLLAVGGLLTELALFIKIVGNGKVAMATGIGLLFVSTAILILVNAVKKLGEMKYEAIEQGLIAVGILLAELGGFVRLAGGSKKMISIGIGIAIISASLLILQNVVEKLGSLDLIMLGKGLGSIFVLLGTLAGAMALMGPGAVGKGIGIVIVASALKIIADVITKLGALDLVTLGKGIGSIFVSLGLLAGILSLMTGTIGGAAALLIASAALEVLAHVLKKFGSLEWGVIIKGFAAMAGSLGILLAAAAVAQLVAPGLLVLGGALALIGVGVGLVGAGILALSLGLAGLATSGVYGLFALKSGLEIILSLIPLFFTKVAEGIKAFLDSIATIGSSLFNAAVVLGSSLIDGLTVLIPKIIELGWTIITSFLDSILENLPHVMDTAISIAVAFVNGIASRLNDIIDAGFNLVLAFINGITYAINNRTGDVIQAFKDLFNAVLKALGDFILSFFGVGVDDVKAIIDGLKSKIFGEGGIVEEAKNVITEALNGLKGMLGDWVTAGIEAVDGFIQGLKDKAANSRLGKAVKQIFGQNTIDEAENSLEIHSPSKRFIEVGKNTVLGFAQGIDKNADIAKLSIKDLMESITNLSMEEAEDYVKKLSNYMQEEIEKIELDPDPPDYSYIAKNALQTFADGVDKNIDLAKTSIKDLMEKIGELSAEESEKLLNEVNKYIYEALDIDPTITPVMDLSELRKGVLEAKKLTSDMERRSLLGLKDNEAANWIWDSLSYSEKLDALKEKDMAAYRAANPNRAVINYTQNNYSPVALDESEIDRRTKTKFSQTGEVSVKSSGSTSYVLKPSPNLV